MLYFKSFKMTLNYKNEKTLYVILFLYVRFFSYMLFLKKFKTILNYKNVSFP